MYSSVMLPLYSHLSPAKSEKKKLFLHTHLIYCTVLYGWHTPDISSNDLPPIHTYLPLLLFIIICVHWLTNKHKQTILLKW
jgi:hypothetical protein